MQRARDAVASGLSHPQLLWQVQGLTEDILTTIELLASAQALLGSQISNVFRLAAELHCAQKLQGTCEELTNGRDGNLTSTGSVWTMDVPWYQDP